MVCTYSFGGRVRKVDAAKTTAVSVQNGYFAVIDGWID